MNTSQVNAVITQLATDNEEYPGVRIDVGADRIEGSLVTVVAVILVAAQRAGVA